MPASNIRLAPMKPRKSLTSSSRRWAPPRSVSLRTLALGLSQYRLRVQRLVRKAIQYAIDQDLPSVTLV